MPDQRPARAYYRQQAGTYASTNPALPIRRLIEWPAVESLLPDLTHTRVLDAGCGDGTYTAKIAADGADVVGVDFSAELLSRARDQHGEAVSFAQVDLRWPLPFGDRLFDVIVSQLALDHIEEWAPIFDEFERILRPGGHVVCSVSHPPTVWAKIDRESDGNIDLENPSYFEVEPWHVGWSGGSVRKYRRPLTRQTNAAFQAGFVMDGLREAEPTSEYRAEDPERYERWSRRPSTFIVYRFRKPSAEPIHE